MTKRVGSVVGAAQGVAVVIAGDDPPEIGTAVHTEDLTVVGRVVDVFGPVSAPYLAVVTNDDRPPAGLIGDRLYTR